MNQRKLWLATGVVLMGLQSHPVWATRAVGPRITGQITATPSADRIEVDHHVYHITAKTPAARTYRSFSYGQTVDLILEQTAAGQEPTVTAIVKHEGS